MIAVYVSFLVTSALEVSGQVEQLAHPGVYSEVFEHAATHVPRRSFSPTVAELTASGSVKIHSPERSLSQEAISHTGSLAGVNSSISKSARTASPSHRFANQELHSTHRQRAPVPSQHLEMRKRKHGTIVRSPSANNYAHHHHGASAVHLTSLLRSAAAPAHSEISAPPGKNSTLLGALEEPHNKMLLVTVMLLNTLFASFLYLAARVQSRNALAAVEGKKKDPRLPAQNQAAASKRKTGEDCCENDHSKNPARDATRSLPASSSLSTSSGTQESHGQCRGFEAPSAWRDPTVDINVGDSSLQSWSLRRRSEALKRLGGCAVITAVLLLAEVSMGMYIDSLALMSNGFHLLTDVAMYGSLFFAVRESDRAADRNTYSFGLHRLEVVGVLIALLCQYITSGHLLVAAVEHIFTPHHLRKGAGQIIFITATVSLVTNSTLAYWVSKSSNVHSHSHVHGGMASRMVMLHLISDAVQNCLVILTGGMLWIDPELSILDSTCTIAFAFIFICSTMGLMKQLLGIVMERAPEDLNCDQMFKDIERIHGVIGIHCCHAWSIAQGKVAVSAHIHVDSGLQEDVLHQAQIILKHCYGIHHMTLQISDDEDLA